MSPTFMRRCSRTTGFFFFFFCTFEGEDFHTDARGLTGFYFPNVSWIFDPWFASDIVLYRLGTLLIMAQIFCIILSHSCKIWVKIWFNIPDQKCNMFQILKYILWIQDQIFTVKFIHIYTGTGNPSNVYKSFHINTPSPTFLLHKNIPFSNVKMIHNSWKWNKYLLSWLYTKREDILCYFILYAN